MRTLLVILLALSVFNCPSYGQVWSFNEVGIGIKPNIKISPSGKIYIAYMKESFGDGYVKVFTKDDTDTSTSLVTEAYVYGPLDLELDASENAHVVYHDHDSMDAALAIWNGPNWDISYVNSSGHDGWDCTLILDAQGAPHVLSADPTGGVEYGFLQGSTWMVETVDPSDAMYSFATDIELDNNGAVHAAYFIQDSSTMYYASRSNNTWTHEPVQSNALFPSMVLDGSGTPVIAFYHPDLDGNSYASSGAVKIATKNGDDWSVTFVDSLYNLLINSPNFTSGARTPVSLLRTANGSLHLGYTDRDVIKYAFGDIGNWAIETVVDESMNPSNLGQLISMDVDNEGKIHMAYSEVFNNSAGGIVRYGSRESIMDLPRANINCPPDTLISCTDPIDPSITGMPTSDSIDVLFSFQDSTLAVCPMDQVIRRMWYGFLEGESTDTCFQLITVRSNGIETTTLVPTLIQLDSICLGDLSIYLVDSINLGCQVTLDTTFMRTDSVDCELVIYSREFQFTDACLDSTFSLIQSIEVSDYLLVEIENVQIVADSGMSNGSIVLDVSCSGDSLQYDWSNGSSGTSISGLDGGSYSVTISNSLGCNSVLTFEVDAISAGSQLMCPPDTTISCNIFITPAFTGTPSSEGYESIDFFDNIIQNCPDDIIIERFWLGMVDSTQIDTCLQVITVTVDSFVNITIPDTLRLSNVCLDDIDELIEINLNLPCNLGIDSVSVFFDSASCEVFTISADWVFRDECRDTSIHLSQIIIIENPLVAQFENIAIGEDSGDSTGTIFFTTACVLSPLTYAWSDGSMDSTRTGLASGEYTLTISNGSGCADTISFFIPAPNELEIICPADTTLACGSDTAPQFTGSPVIGSNDTTLVFELTFSDSLLQDCPDDQIIRRTWFSTMDTLTETICTQVITVLQSDSSLIEIADTLFYSGICMDSVLSIAVPEITLGCNQVIDSVSINTDMMGCKDAVFTRVWTITNTCADTTMTLQQTLVLNEIPLFVLDNVMISPDAGDSSGAISFGVQSCNADSLSYLWSDSSTSASLDMLPGGDYSVTISNASGCADTFSFFIQALTDVEIICPADTTLTCGSDTAPQFTGSPVISPNDTTSVFVLTFSDSLLQDCPDDQIIRRTWFSTMDTLTETICTQEITVLQSDSSLIEIADTLFYSGICVDSVLSIAVPEITLGCNQVIDTMSTRTDMMGCKDAVFTRVWTITNTCADTTMTLQQTLVLNEIPLFVLDDVMISPDAGDSSGAISFSVQSCNADSLSYLWSDSSTSAALTMVPEGDYSVIISNTSGCVDSFSFVIPAPNEIEIICPADTTLTCGSDTAPEFTGSPVISPNDTSLVFVLTFSDSLLQDCPGDQVIRRTWFSTMDTLTETICTQVITVLQSDSSLIEIADTLFYSGICVDSVLSIAVPEITLGCNQVIDSMSIRTDMMGCKDAAFTRIWTITNACADTTITLQQTLVLNEIPLFVLDEIMISPDAGDSSGTISFSVQSCNADSLSYLWSDSSTSAALTMVPGGDYSVIISNTAGCLDSFSFIVPTTGSMVLDCPSDTTVSCLSSLDPSATGVAKASGYDSLRYEDITVGGCPEDLMIERRWIAFKDSTAQDTCIQLITVTQSPLEISAPDSLFLVGICVPDVELFLSDSLTLGCNQQIDTSYLQTDTLDCDFGLFTRVWEITDVCRDTTILVRQSISLQSIPTAVITNIDLTEDPGDNTGGVSFDIACIGDTATYAWSDGSNGRDLIGVMAGSYSLTVTTELGCSESFIFFVPALDTLIINCPADTVLSCNASIDPSNTGMASGVGIDSLYYVDRTVQECPGDIIINRVWIAMKDSIQADSCTQIITVLQDDLFSFDIPDTLIFDGICFEDLQDSLVTPEISACHQFLEAISFNEDSLACGFGLYNRIFTVRDSCRDTSFQFIQFIQLENIPLAVLTGTEITADLGDQSGSISPVLDCVADSLTYAWSNGASSPDLLMIAGGEYQLTISSPTGCIDSFAFIVPLIDTIIFNCPPDTIIDCSLSTEPSSTGEATAIGYDTLYYIDSTLQDCPGDLIVLRSWISSRDSTLSDTCLQRITVRHDGLEAITIADSLVFDNICLEELESMLSDTFIIGCQQVVDTVQMTIDSLTCGYASLTRQISITDACLDTTVVVSQFIELTNIPVIKLDDIEITGDPGDTSGSVVLSISCNADSLTYAWSNGTDSQDANGLSAGTYGLTVTNGLSCTDSFTFEVPFIDTTMLFCPPDTTINCDQSTDPEVTGMATIAGFTSVNFSDLIVQDCPGDLIIERTWFAALGDVDFDTCRQTITVINSGLEAIQFADSLTFDTLCVADLYSMIDDFIQLGCDQVVDSSAISIDTLSCDMGQFTQVVYITDNCLDTSILLVRHIRLNDIPPLDVSGTQITGDVGDTSGSILLDVSCATDSLTYAWSSGQSQAQIEDLSSGTYTVTITNDLGCLDSFSFVVPFIDTTTLTCPPDTTLACGSSFEPAITGTATIEGFNNLTFNDSIVQDCPGDLIIERMWIATLDDKEADTCVQRITLEHSGLEAIGTLPPINLSGICIDDLHAMLSDSIALGCSQYIDSIFMVMDSVACGYAQMTRTFAIADSCLDTLVMVNQLITLEDLPLAVIAEENIAGDIGDTTGNILLELSCTADSLSYLWSNGDTTLSIDGLSSGEYTLTLTNTIGCSDSFTFNVPFIDTSTTLFTVNAVRRDGSPLELTNVRFLDLAQNEIEATLRNSAVGNYDYGVPGGLDNVEYVCPVRALEPAIDQITVVDLIRGQRYILGLSDGCPEDEIAGDVNFSGDISGSDLVLMRRIMLGLDESFPDSLTWTFVVEGSNQNRLMNVDGCVQLLEEDRTNQGILVKGIKLGDYQCQD